jgi:hypothetical protein
MKLETLDLMKRLCSTIALPTIGTGNRWNTLNNQEALSPAMGARHFSNPGTIAAT